MRWLRGRLQQGSWLALLALAINLALSFGHLHLALRDGRTGGLLRAHATAVQKSGAAGDHDRSRADDLCPICMAAGALGSALASLPPSLEVPIALGVESRDPAPQWTTRQSAHTAFWSRGPPLS